MLVAHVGLRDFRNCGRGEIELSDGLTIVCGPNGAGKTNLLEAIYFGLTARSCRTSNEREVVGHGGGPARVAVTTIRDGERHVLETALDLNEGKRVRVDGSPAGGPASLDARPPVCVFIPDRLELVKGAPAHRRAHLDRFVAAVWPSRAGTRVAYGRALGQRNALLARVRSGGASAAQLDAWDDQLGRSGAALMEDRSEAVEQLAPCFAARTTELGLPLRAAIRYRPRSRAQDALALTAELAERRSQDIERGFTTHGPHRDDLVLTHDDRALRSFGSQGQQRLSVLALLFAERDVLAERGREPLMLLDDVMSELDATRRARLVQAILASGQTLVTAADPEHLPGAAAAGAAILNVEAGEVRAAPRAVAA